MKATASCRKELGPGRQEIYCFYQTELTLEEFVLRFAQQAVAWSSGLPTFGYPSPSTQAPSPAANNLQYRIVRISEPEPLARYLSPKPKNQ